MVAIVLMETKLSVETRNGLDIEKRAPLSADALSLDAWCRFREAGGIISLAR